MVKQTKIFCLFMGICFALTISVLLPKEGKVEDFIMKQNKKYIKHYL